ncbi:CBS domain-containing protein [Streptomyces sp. NPDC097704]|uniref:CBS domain-containing protein n=1 Tax=Streptomyces sp. NPDC097704 TaxID=3157101 RepID=UPI003333630C
MVEGKDPTDTTVHAVCSTPPVTVRPDGDLDHAVELMREHALRRLPVTGDGRPVSIVMLGDSAVEKDPKSAPADISSRPRRRTPDARDQAEANASDSGRERVRATRTEGVMHDDEPAYGAAHPPLPPGARPAPRASHPPVPGRSAGTEARALAHT